MSESVAKIEEPVGQGGGPRPELDLGRLMTTVFEVKPGERVAVLIDLRDARRIHDLAFLIGASETAKLAYQLLYKGLVGLKDALGLAGVDLFACEETGGPNLDLPAQVYPADGEPLALEEALGRCSVVLFAGAYAATAPLAALAKKLGLRGASLHGLDADIARTGLALDFAEVAARTERLRAWLGDAERAALTFAAGGERCELTLALGERPARSAGGLARAAGEVTELPAGEVYWVPEGAEGLLPQQLSCGAVGLFAVEGGVVRKLHKLLSGDMQGVRDYLAMIDFDPRAARVTKLGLGTEELPLVGAEVQDRKVLGVAHVGTGRSDHLGGDVDATAFRDRRNAMHRSVVFAPAHLPGVTLERLALTRGGEATTLIEAAAPTAALREALA